MDRRRRARAGRGGGPERIGPVLDRALAALGLETRARAQLAVVLWPEVAGARAAGHAQAVAARGGTLFVVADSPVWAQELTFLKPKLLEAYARRLGPGVVTDLRFRTGSSRAPPAGPGADEAAGTPGRRALDEVAVPGRARRVLSGATGQVRDPGLRRRIRRVLETAYRLAAWRARQGWPPCPECGLPMPPEGPACPACRWRRAP